MLLWLLPLLPKLLLPSALESSFTGYTYGESCLYGHFYRVTHLVLKLGTYVHDNNDAAVSAYAYNRSSTLAVIIPLLPSTVYGLTVASCRSHFECRSSPVAATEFWLQRRRRQQHSSVTDGEASRRSRRRP